MQNFVELIQNINSKVNSVVWGPPMLILMLLTGLYLTCGTRFFQIRRFCYTIKNTVAAIFKDRKVTKTKDEKAISQFQALATALAATVGTGNIVGVATAISSGGAGAVFWMWISALLGMMTSFSENALGIYFRRKNEKGEWVHKSGVAVKDFVKTFAENEDNAFLFKQKQNSGNGSQNIPPSSNTNKKSLFEMTQDEVLQMAAEGKLPGR